MKPFDLEAAKRGEPISWNGKRVHFVGQMLNGSVVVDVSADTLQVFNEAGTMGPDGAPKQPLMMEPKTVTVWTRHYLTSCGTHVVAETADSPSDNRLLNSSHINWLGPAFKSEYEVEE